MTTPGNEATRSEIVPTATPEMELVAPASAEKVLAAFKAFEWLKQNLITEADRQQIGETTYIKKSGWMKIALACNVSLEKREEKVERDGDTVTYHYTYRALAPSGRFADADGSASSGERDFSHMPHDVRALAQTRACNRAVSNLVGGGEVSAEELAGPGQLDVEGGVYIVDREAVLNALERAGLDASQLNVYPEEGVLIIEPMQFIGEAWAKYRDALRPLGAEWVRMGKGSRWEIRLSGDA